MHILVTNDDGVHAPGLLALAQGLRPLGKLTILAPHRSWSASGHVKTMHRPIRAWTTHLADGTPATATDGAPSDCVALALLGLIEEPIDLIVSGINPFANVGYDVTYSGTVTAAMEATIAGIPGIAVSLDSNYNHNHERDYAPAAQAAASIARHVHQHGLPKDVLLSVNVPARPMEQIRGFAITRQGKRIYRDELVSRDDPRAKPYYWIGGRAPTGIPEEGTDFWALSEGFVSITPLHLDLTAYAHINTFQEWRLGS